jgi:hypothetical protein
MIRTNRSLRIVPILDGGIPWNNLLFLIDSCGNLFKKCCSPEILAFPVKDHPYNILVGHFKNQNIVSNGYNSVTPAMHRRVLCFAH